MKGRVLITGANGFIGGFIVQEAINKDLDVYALLRKNSDKSSLQGLDVKILEVDFTRPDELAAILVQYQFEYIIHNAGLTRSPDADELMRVNKGILVTLVNAIRTSSIRLKKLTYISSLAATGPADQVAGGMLTEQTIPNPVTHYGVSKLAAENYLKDQTDIPYIIIRPTAVYGPKEKDLLNVFKMISKGIDIQPGILGQKLTFIYVKDLATLILLATLSEKVNKAYFATDGHVYTSDAFSGFVKQYMNKWTIKIRMPLILIKGLAYISQKMAGLWDSYPIFNLEKVKEISAKNWNCDVSNLYHDLGFKAAYDLTTGIPETISWYKENKWL